MKNVFALVNPASANSSTARIWPEIAACLRAKGVEFTEFLTTGAYQAPQAVRQALRQGFTTIISVGGDGTVNEVINGFFEDRKPVNPEARLAVISRGTGCDLIRTLNIPKDYPQAIDTMMQGRERRIDLGMAEYYHADGSVGERLFINIADAGMGAMVATRVNHTSKSTGGFLSFLYGTLWSIIIFKNGPARIEVDGETIHDGMITMAALANGCYFGGGMNLSPDSSMDDGTMELVLLKGMNKFTLFTNLARIYRGSHLTHPKISVHPAQRVTIKIDRRKPLLLEMDGETPGVTPFRFSVLPKALRILC